MKVLVADDDAINLRIIRAFLEKWSFEVVVAADGKQAWEILQLPDAPRLAVIDWVMPGFDGLELCRTIRAQLQSHYVYVILLTGKAQQREIIAGLEAGADD